MDPTIKRIYQFVIAGGIVTLFLILSLANPVILNSSDFCVYNSGWNGCSDIGIKTYETGKFQPTVSFNGNELTLSQNSFVDYDIDPQNSTIFIIGPRTAFSSREGTYIQNFLENGGMLLLADDFGSSNDLLNKINASSRFSGELMLDLSFEKKASFVTIFDFLNRSHPLTSNVSHMLFNYPTSITAGHNTTVLAVSTEMSWLDKNVDGKKDGGETKGPFPVLVIEPYGKGEIVLLSGPSLLINSMKDQLGNNIFRENLFYYLYNERDTVIIDESHRDVAMPLQIAYVFPSTIGLEVKVFIVLLVVVAFIVGFTTIPKDVIKKLEDLLVRSKDTPKEGSLDEIIEQLMEKHPSWSRNKLEKIVQRMR